MFFTIVVKIVNNTNLLNLNNPINCMFVHSVKSICCFLIRKSVFLSLTASLILEFSLLIKCDKIVLVFDIMFNN